MRKRKNRLNMYLAALPAEHGRLPDYDRLINERRNLDYGNLTPAIQPILERNCKTVLRLQSALQWIAVNKTRLSYKEIQHV